MPCPICNDMESQWILGFLGKKAAIRCGMCGIEYLVPADEIGEGISFNRRLHPTALKISLNRIYQKRKNKLFGGRK